MTKHPVVASGAPFTAAARNAGRVLAASAVLLSALLCTACRHSSGAGGDGIDQPQAGDIKFSVAQDYPSSTVTYLGSASPGAVTYLYRDGHADEHADLVMGNTGGGPVVLYGIGEGKFTAQRTVIDNTDTDASAVDVADFNADGIPDIVSGGYKTPYITVVLGRPDGSFGLGGQHLLDGVWPSQFQIADYNRDGHLDIATAAYFGGTITMLLGNGDGTFRAGPSAPGTNYALALLAADFDGDGITDLAVPDSSFTPEIPAVLGEASGNLAHGFLHIRLGNGDGTFRVTDIYPVGALSEMIRYGDIDEDGNKDLVVFNALINNEASILYGLGGGKFAPEQRMRLGGPSSVNVLDVRSADGAEGLQLLDFNGDGHLDMAVTQMISSRLVIFQGDGRGHFTPAGSYDVAGFPEDLMAGDLNGDGCQDLAVPGNLVPIGPSDVGIARVSVLLNLSAGCQ